MSFVSNEEIEELVHQFERKTLPKSAWTHTAHLTVGMYYTFHHTFHEALCLMKSKIITYNEAVGTVNTSSSGYHETLTVFWLKIIDNYLQNRRNKPLFELCNEFLLSGYATKETPLLHYSKERLFSTEARAIWCEPNLQPMKFIE